MKKLWPLCLVPLVAVSCANWKNGNLPSPGAPEQEATDVAIVHEFSDTAINNGIIAEHTLFAYHFVDGSAELNELGKRELAVLCDHYRTYGGSLNVHRGETSDALYQKRVDRVTQFLASGGVKGQVTISDGAPGGAGVASEDVITMLRAKDGTVVDYQTPGKVSVPAVKGEQQQ